MSEGLSGTLCKWRGAEPRHRPGHRRVAACAVWSDGVHQAYARPDHRGVMTGLPLLYACKMRAHGSSQAGGCRTAQHDGTALTCENTTNRSQTTQGVTDPVLLLICGFGVQVPGGALCLTWGFAISPHRSAAVSHAQIIQISASCAHGLHASKRRVEVCGCGASCARLKMRCVCRRLTGRRAD